jgi:hypothetical protein
MAQIQNMKQSNVNVSMKSNHIENTNNGLNYNVSDLNKENEYLKKEREGLMKVAERLGRLLDEQVEETVNYKKYSSKLKEELMLTETKYNLMVDTISKTIDQLGNSINCKLEAVAFRLDNRNSLVRSLNSKVDGLNVKIESKLIGNIQRLSSNVGSIKEDMGSMKGNVESMKGDVISMKADVESMKEDSEIDLLFNLKKRKFESRDEDIYDDENTSNSIHSGDSSDEAPEIDCINSRSKKKLKHEYIAIANVSGFSDNILTANAIHLDVDWGNIIDIIYIKIFISDEHNQNCMITSFITREDGELLACRNLRSIIVDYYKSKYSGSDDSDSLDISFQFCDKTLGENYSDIITISKKKTAKGRIPKKRTDISDEIANRFSLYSFE